MKRLIILLAVVFYCVNTSAQTGTDSTVKSKHRDTLRIGNIVIIRKGSKNPNGSDSTGTAITTSKKKSRLTTNWGGVDIGFSNYSDKTNYVAATADGFLRNNPASPALG